MRFNFNPTIPVTPGAIYYFDVVQTYLETIMHGITMSETPTHLVKDGCVESNGSLRLPFDWAFKTEFYNPPPHSERREGHYVTCAGVNSEESKIAFSDPTLDIANPSPVDHNDAANVSHDIYNVSIGSPQPDINTQWWLSDYHAGYNYTVVEQAVVICPVPDTTKPTVEDHQTNQCTVFPNIEIFEALRRHPDYREN